ncbi:LGFP repeat-containing protein [Blastococcus sp. URHD0036]|uniref:LGFP repeat-containing protein n=1 Tax=Blastococcus sp. URHD0036 TaxID=1380356 RepID=UPI000497AA99|nr:LGFP repeat-containing protein [Blastococcus sp. URHD0036]
MPLRRPGVLTALLALVLAAGLLHVPSATAAPVCTQADPVVRHHCELGGVTGFLGAPTAAVLPAPDRVGRFQYYAGGSIYWTPSTGAHEVHGAILATWRTFGWERSFLGYPVTDELTAPDGIGRGSFFQGGAIYWTPSTGAHEVHGAILATWREMGWERSVLGYPVTDEFSMPDGVGRASFFQGGAIYWTPATGAHEVHGAILATWASMGWERSPLGYPITDEYGVNAGRQSDFQGGFLRWTAATGAVRTALLGAYDRSGTWVSRFGFSREFGGANPPIPPSAVGTMAAAGVDTIYLQAASKDPRYPDLISPDLLGQFLTRAHARGIQVVAWYLPEFTDVEADLRRLRAMVDFRAAGQGFDAVAVDIEDLTVTDVDLRNARLVDLSTRLAAYAPTTTLGAIVLPPVATDVLNPTYWPRFPWRELAPLYQVWMPMAYWSNRTAASGWRDAYRYTSENIARVRSDLGEPCAAVSVIGGFGTDIPASDYAAMARAAADRGAIGVSIWDWNTTPAASWPPVRDYAVRGC